MIEKNKIKFIYGISLVFLAINFVLFALDFYWMVLLPAVILVLFMFFFSLDKLMILVVFFTPLSFTLKDVGFNLPVNLSILTEPFLFGIMILFFLKIILEGGLDKEIYKHPVSKAILFNLAWITLTTVSSTMFVVSLKFLVARLWFVITFYYLFTILFKNYRNIKVFSWAYLIPFVAVIIYTIYMHKFYGFDEESAHWVMSPFYNDHTAYGAALAIMTPFLFYFIFNRYNSFFTKIIAIGVLGIFAVAIVLSYSRAAWISLAAAAIVAIILLLHINYRIVILGTIGVVIAFFLLQNDIFMKMEKNKQDSSKNLAEHVQSISNISSDASNVERINRWLSAFRMFELKPILGWGPGTYQFKYAPFQLAQERTIISTNSGEKGNAHSEYIGPLAESGVLGSLSFLGILITVVYTGIKVFKRAKSKEIRFIALAALTGLITYFVHGTLNNFLDTDKLSAPFWGFVAAIVALDLYHLNITEQKKSETI